MTKTNRKISKKNVLLSGLVFTGALTVLAGCQTDNSGMDSFFPKDEARSTQQFMTAQAASGARADATLQPCHFDGDKLNSLGMAKLDLMLKDDDSVDPMTVYINLGEKDATLAARKDSITQYLVDHGLVKDQIALKTGENPDSKSLSAEHLSRMSRTESTMSDSSAPQGGTTSDAAAGTTKQ